MRPLKNIIIEGLFVGITLLIVGESLNCLSGFCFTDPRRQNKNLIMFGHYIILGLIVHMIYEYTNLNNMFCDKIIKNQ